MCWNSYSTRKILGRLLKRSKIISTLLGRKTKNKKNNVNAYKDDIINASLTFIEGLSGIGHFSKHYVCINSFNVIHPYKVVTSINGLFTEEETEV